jgi:hypothetical protein
MGQFFVSFRKAFRNLYVLTFLNGFLIACLFFFHILSVYEKGLFDSVKSSINASIKTGDGRDSLLVRSMHACHELMHSRANVFIGNSNNLGPEGGIFRSPAVDLNTTGGACGSYSEVLARVLGSYHYPVRIAQMMVAGKYGGHIVVEACDGDRWVALDPSYNVFYVRPDGHLASISDIRGNWNFYRHQTPPGYNPAYRYEEVRYTNWSKIPVLLPALKKILTWTIGPGKTNHLSIRVLFLHVYDIYFYITLALEIALFLGTIRIRIRIHRNPQPLRLEPGF